MATKKNTTETNDPGIELDDLWREKKARGDKPRRVVRVLYLTNERRGLRCLSLGEPPDRFWWTRSEWGGEREEDR